MSLHFLHCSRSQGAALSKTMTSHMSSVNISAIVTLYTSRMCFKHVCGGMMVASLFYSKRMNGCPWKNACVCFERNVEPVSSEGVIVAAECKWKMTGQCMHHASRSTGILLDVLRCIKKTICLRLLAANIHLSVCPSICPCINLAIRD